MNCRQGQPLILVVEDDDSLRRLVVEILKSGGFEAVSAGNAAGGLAIVRSRGGAIDLAIVDMMMPGVSGLDLATDLSREYPELKILYISGFVHSLAANVLSRHSPDRVLLKPFDPPTLLERVRILLAQPPRRDTARADQPAAPPFRNGTRG